MSKRKNNSRQMRHYQQALEKCREKLAKIEQNPAYACRPDVKAMRLRDCLLKIQEIEGQIRRCGKLSPSVRQYSQRVKKMAQTSSYTGMERPYSSGGWSSNGRASSYTRTNAGHPYSGGRCSPR